VQEKFFLALCIPIKGSVTGNYGNFKFFRFSEAEYRLFSSINAKIQAVTGHKSALSVDRYKRCNGEQSRRECSDTLNKRLKNAPSNVQSNGGFTLELEGVSEVTTTVTRQCAKNEDGQASTSYSANASHQSTNSPFQFNNCTVTILMNGK
jgi:hypothetical protein